MLLAVPQLFVPYEDLPRWPAPPPLDAPADDGPDLPREPALPPPPSARRADEDVTFTAGKRKGSGTLLRLAETRVRIRTAEPPALYERIQVAIAGRDKGAPPLELTCDVTRVRPPGESVGESAVFDARVTAGHSAATMARLRKHLGLPDGPATTGEVE